MATVLTGVGVLVGVWRMLERRVTIFPSPAVLMGYAERAHDAA